MAVLLDTVVGEIRDGRVVLLIDREAEPGEGMLCVAADRVTPDVINFMASSARGLICLVMTEDDMRRLGIPLLAPDSGRGQPAFGASIEARDGVTTGISASDRATTILAAVGENAPPDGIVMPGHVFPVQARAGGVLMRAGLFEGALDLVRLAGRSPSAAVCTVLGEDGEIAGVAELERFGRAHDLRVVELRDIVAQRLRKETLVRRTATADLPTAFGASFRAIVYHNSIDQHEHLALILGPEQTDEPVLVRVHSQCVTGDVLGSERCDCGEQLRAGVDRMRAAGAGVVLYMHQEGRGIGLANKLRAYALQDQGRDTVEANLELGFKEDLRDYGIAAQILRDLGLLNIRLLTNNPQKVSGLERYGIHVVERVSLEVPPRPSNIEYLRAKQEKLGHLLTGLPSRT
jgi:3,4-dihydroxy 2-butanone 4-phosphate synthase/GTP cyclohydrolase II